MKTVSSEDSRDVTIIAAVVCCSRLRFIFEMDLFGRPFSKDGAAVQALSQPSAIGLNITFGVFTES